MIDLETARDIYLAGIVSMILLDGGKEVTVENVLQFVADGRTLQEAKPGGWFAYDHFINAVLAQRGVNIEEGDEA